MYNSKEISKFIEKANIEAQEAAQKVYDRMQEELLKRIQNQLKEGDTMVFGNGTAVISRNGETTYNLGEKLCQELSDVQYHRVQAGFDLPYKFSKTEILKQ